MTLTLVLAACFFVWLAAYRHAASDRGFLNLALVTLVLSGIMLFWTPTPRGYDPNLGSYRIGGDVMTRIGPRMAAVLFAVSAMSLLCAAVGVHGRSPAPPSEE
ncbi:MAG TPA: hypothetical protein VFO19_20810 [Vicinamibacterales bacterium]|nr:hypothetical protein [Vicinamibacterales bacterium]